MATELDERTLEQLYTWIDGIPLSRPKKDLKRDFSDGGMKSFYKVPTHHPAQKYEGTLRYTLLYTIPKVRRIDTLIARQPCVSQSVLA